MSGMSKAHQPAQTGCVPGIRFTDMVTAQATMID